MHRFLQSKSLEDKVRSIERMRRAARLAREAMRLATETPPPPSAILEEAPTGAQGAPKPKCDVKPSAS